MTIPHLTLTPTIGPAGAPLIVLGPSLGTSTILWDEVVPELAARYRVPAWDLPGHGASAPTTASEIAPSIAPTFSRTTV